MNTNRIKAALSDPKAPWYGSDLVVWVADLLAELEAEPDETAKFFEQTKAQPEPSDIANTLRDISEESALNKAERISLRQIAKVVDRQAAELEEYHNIEKFVDDPPTDQQCCSCAMILRVRNKRLNLILFHRENGLAHPDLQGEIDKSKLAEETKELHDRLHEVSAGNLRLKEELQELSNQMMEKYEIWDNAEKGTVLGWHQRIQQALE